MSTLRDLPSGTVTFMFTDIEGSTALWEKYPELMLKALDRHDAIADEVVARHHGFVVKPRGEGDSLFIVFADPVAALRAVVDLQLAFLGEPWPEETPIKVRMALHTGPAHLIEDDYRGSTVNRSARIRAVAHGGQIIVSEATRVLIGPDEPSGIGFKAMGAHRLKDLVEPVELFQVLNDGLPIEFPPLKSLGAVANNLPIMLTSLVGRERELQDVRGLLRTAHIVTISGAGGSGKTRLAIHAAAEEVEHFPDGVFFLDLTEVREEDAIGPLIARVMELPLQGAQSLERAVLDHLASRTALLIFDNCEHVVAGAAKWVKRIATGASKVRIIATSREILNLHGEAVYRVPTLGVPDASLTKVSDILGSDAVQLFADRAKLVSPDFEIERHAQGVLNVCRALDGIPLAIELAASRVRAMTVEQIEKGLNDRFRFLRSQSREVLPRQQTLRALVDWSYELLDPQEQRLLQRLSVFVGTFTLDAIVAICADDEVQDYEVFDLVTRLVDKSLLVYESPRYRLLQTVHRYVSERLDEAGGGELLCQAHQAYYAQLVEEQSKFFGTEQREALEIVQADYGNVRAAIEAGMQEPQLLPQASAMALNLNLFWYGLGQYEEAHALLATLAELNETAEQAETAANLLNSASTMARQTGNLERAEAHLRKSLELRRPDDHVGRSAALTNLASVAIMKGEHEQAIGLLREAIALAEPQGESSALLRCRIILGNALQQSGDLEGANAELVLAVSLAEKLGDSLMLTFALNNLANVTLKRGDVKEADRLLSETVRRAIVAHQIPLVETTLRQIAQVRTELAKYEDAALFEGLAAELRERHGMPLAPADEADYSAQKERVDAALGVDAEEVRARGRALTLDQAGALFAPEA